MAGVSVLLGPSDGSRIVIYATRVAALVESLKILEIYCKFAASSLSSSCSLKFDPVQSGRSSGGLANVAACSVNLRRSSSGAPATSTDGSATSPLLDASVDANGNRHRHPAALFGVTQKPDPETLKALNKNITDEFAPTPARSAGDSKCFQQEHPGKPHARLPLRRIEAVRAAPAPRRY